MGILRSSARYLFSSIARARVWNYVLFKDLTC